MHDLIQGPKVVAFKLARKATLNRDQMCLVALFASFMQAEWEKQLADEPQLKDSSASCWSLHNGDAPLMSLIGRVIARLLIVGGGGCGKSRIINMVLSPLLRTYYGRRGLMKEAQSNRAARGIGGITVHAANRLMGDSSLIVIHLRPKPHQKATLTKYGR